MGAEVPPVGVNWKDWLDILGHVLAWFKGPAGMGILVNTFWVQTLEAWDHFLPAKMLKPGTTDISKAMAITLGLALTMGSYVAYALLAIALGWGRVEESTFGYGFVGCFGGVGLSALLDWKGWNLEKLFGQEGK